MSWTVQSLGQALITNIGSEAVDEELLNEINAWINEGYKDLIRKYAWPWTLLRETIPVVANTKEYALQNTAMEIVGVRLSDVDKELIYVAPQEMLNLDLEATHEPQYFYISNYDPATEKLKITIQATPSQAYTMDVFERLRPINLPTTTTIPCPEEFVDLIRMFVKARVFDDDGDFQNGKNMKGEYENAVKVTYRRLGHVNAAHRVMRVSDIKTGSPQSVQFSSKYEAWEW